MAPAKIIQRWSKHKKVFQESHPDGNTPHQARIKRWELGVVIGLSILLSLVYYFPILNSGDNLGIQDWDQNFAWTEANRISLLEYHQFPLWNPYKCGGTVQFANPQVPVISLQTLFALAMGTLRGIKISIVFHGVIGFIGFYYLARQIKLSYLGSTLAAMIFSFSGITGSFLSTGMVVFTSFAYTPFILIAYNKSMEKARWGILSGTLFALSFYYSYQIALLVGVFLIVYTAVKCIIERTLAPFKAFLIVMLTSSVLILPKLVFAYQLLRISPRLLPDISGYSLQNFAYFLLSRNQNLFNVMNAQGYFYRIDENSIYVGILTLALFLLFFVKNKKSFKEHAPLLVTLFFLIWLMLGNGVYPSLYAILKRLPIFSSFRVAQRFRFDFIIPFSLIAGLGLDNIYRLIKSNKLAMPITFFCLGVVYLDLAIFSGSNFLSKTLIIINPEDQLKRGDAFIQTVANKADFVVQRSIQIPDVYLNDSTFFPWSYEYLKIRQNQGVLECYDPIPLGVMAVGISEEGYQGEFHLLMRDDSLKVENVSWSPNKLVFTLSGNSSVTSNTLIVNQNFYPGWIVKKVIYDCDRATFVDKLIATKIDGSSGEISFEFNPLAYYTTCR